MRVCNAVSKFCGLSPNDTMLAGPDLLTNLMGFLVRFQQKPFALSADIEEMFLQVERRAEDSENLRFLWQTADRNIQTYRNNRHICGAKFSPACANFALQKCARDNADEFVLASRFAQTNFYMDCFLVSVDTKDEAIILKKEEGSH